MCGDLPVSRIILKQKGLSTAVGDEGGLHRILQIVRRFLGVIVEAVEKAGYEPGKDICIAIDAAASELYDEETEAFYVFRVRGKMKGKRFSGIAAK